MALGAVALAACADQQSPDTSSPVRESVAKSLPVLQTAVAEAGTGSSGPFNITLRFITRTTAGQREVFRTSASRWQRIIVEDVPATRGTIPPNFCGDFGTPQFSGQIDDILIDVLLAPIDGPGNILGAAGPCAIRLEDDLPVYGIMFFDTDDLDFIEQFGLLEEVIIHEMGHVLGFGTVWDFPRPLIRNSGTRNPRFTGRNAQQIWLNLGGRGYVPLEQDGGPGTAESHWDEETFDNELMTGFLGLGRNPLSNLSAMAMKDIGYGARREGDAYRLPGAPLIAGARRQADGLNIASRERLVQPKGAIK